MLQFSTLEKYVFLILLVGALSIFAVLARKIVAVIKSGAKDSGRLSAPGTRFLRIVREVLLQSRVVSGRPIVGLLHTAVFLAFLLFILETVNMFLEPFGFGYLHVLPGDSLHTFRVFVVIIAVFCTISMVGLTFRRFVLVKISPDPKSYESGFVALLIILLMLTYIDMNVTNIVAPKVNWWLHVVIILAFPAIILNSKHRHIFLAPIAVYLRKFRLWDVPRMNLDFESADSEDDILLGLETISAIPWKLRLDMLACVECKRCTDNCPAAIAGQDLRPADFIKAGQKALFTDDREAAVIGTVITEEALGNCTTCMACENVCPVGVEHSQLLAGSKAAQTLALGTGGVATEFLKAVSNYSNPFSAMPDVRSSLIDELEIPLLRNGETEYLLWMGCVWSYNSDFKSTVAATNRLLKNAGVSFGVLETENCSGHHSRKQGEEMQFQMLAEENCAQFIEQNVSRIVTGCPHCVNTLRYEYAEYLEGHALEVTHHSELFAGLVDSGALNINPGSGNGKRVTYHDPCYLGRYERVFNEPRSLIGRAGCSLVETVHKKDRSYCCGGGAAGFTRESVGDQRVDQVRKSHIEKTGVGTLVTACPECKMMLAGTVEETKDIAELLLEAMEDPGLTIR